MDKLLSLLAFLASLGGCDLGRDTVVHRVVDGGADLLLSRASMQDGVARFDCVRSSSGRCHYLVLPRGCDDARRCGTAARRFVVEVGGSRQVAGLHRFRVCVGSVTRIEPSQCTASGAGWLTSRNEKPRDAGLFVEAHDADLRLSDRGSAR